MSSPKPALPSPCSALAPSPAALSRAHPPPRRRRPFSPRLTDPAPAVRHAQVLWRGESRPGSDYSQSDRPAEPVRPPRRGRGRVGEQQRRVVAQGLDRARDDARRTRREDASPAVPLPCCIFDEVPRLERRVRACHARRHSRRKQSRPADDRCVFRSLFPVPEPNVLWYKGTVRGTRTGTGRSSRGICRRSSSTATRSWDPSTGVIAQTADPQSRRLDLHAPAACMANLDGDTMAPLPLPRGATHYLNQETARLTPIF